MGDGPCTILTTREPARLIKHCFRDLHVRQAGKQSDRKPKLSNTRSSEALTVARTRRSAKVTKYLDVSIFDILPTSAGAVGWSCPPRPCCPTARPPRPPPGPTPTAPRCPAQTGPTLIQTQRRRRGPEFEPPSIELQAQATIQVPRR